MVKDGSIVFDKLQKKDGRIDFCCTYHKGDEIFSKDVFFEMNASFTVGNDIIALALSTLCGQAFKEIIFAFFVSANVVKSIELFTKAKIRLLCEDNLDVNEREAQDKSLIVKEKENIILNFSGGLDSLAAYYLLPKNTKLVAIDFGSWFKRERVFFEKFNPYILKTNFRELKLDRFSWTFMGAGAILFSEYLNAKYNVFGTILEASVDPFIRNTNFADRNKTMPFYGAGLYDIRYTHGLTEVGTAIIATYYAADIISESLESLAENGSEKRQRKELLLTIVCKKFGRKISIPKSIEPKIKVPFGKNFALDFLCIYIIKNLGIEAAEKTMCNIPKQIIEFAQKHDLSFYERVNTDYVSGLTIPNNKLRADYMNRLICSGVLPYTAKDFTEFREVADLLNSYHKFESVKKDVMTEKQNETLLKEIKSGHKQIQEMKKKQKKMEREFECTRKELNNIKNGWSFKTGRIITFLPRKIRDLGKR